MRIAGRKTDKQWKTLAAKLRSNPTPELWKKAYREFYRQRIKTRYMDPIASIKQNDRELGEGFAIVALICTLFEFLESCESGKNFVNLPTSPNSNEYGWRQASGIFKGFLNRPPFDQLVPRKLVDSFYRDLRCGLLHEARTSSGWTLSTEPSSGALISEHRGRIVLYRNELIPSLEKYFKDYRARLLQDIGGAQKAFLGKFDHLCKP